MDPAIQPPSLLEVNRQIRNEAINAYYSSNLFILNVVDLNVQPLLPFLEIFKKCARRSPPTNVEHKNVQIEFNFVRGFHWKNFKAWIEAIFMAKMGGPSEDVEEDDDPDFKAIRGAFGVFYGMIRAGATWKQVEETLLGLRVMLGAMNKQWLKDYDD
jgi:hypothetical protein